MRAIARALNSLASLTGLSFFRDLAQPFDKIESTRTRIENEIKSKKAHLNATRKDISDAVKQNKVS